MKNINAYSKEVLDWNGFMNSLSNEIEKYVTKEIGLGSTKSDIQGGIYDILTKKDFDGKAFDFIYNSSKLADPSLTKERFMKEFTKRKINGKKINLFDNIDNNATTDRIMARFDNKISPIVDRADRIKKYRDRLDRFSDARSTGDVGRTIETIGTRYKNLETELLASKRGLRNTSLFTSERKIIKQKIKDMEIKLKAEKESYKSLKKEFDSVVKMKGNTPDATFNKKYLKILDKVETDLRERQIPFEIKQTVKSSAGEQVKTTAKTELAFRNHQNEVDQYIKLRDSVKSSELLVAKYELNPNRTWAGHDICDDNAAHNEGLGKGVYKADDVPSVPAHPNCQCQVTYFKMKKP